MSTSPRQMPLAVVGLGCLFPGSPSPRAFWRHLAAGSDLFGDVPSHYWLVDDYYDPDPSKPDKVYGKRGGFLPPVSFDPVHFGVPPTVMSTTDTAQLLAMWVAQQVLVDVTGSPEGDGLERDRVSVVLGVAAGLTLLGDMAGRAQRPVWEDALRSCGVDEAEVERLADRISAQYAAWTETTFPGVLGNVVAGRIANRFDFGGTNFTTDAACASSFSALRAAAQELWLHEADLVITGGVDTTNDPYLFMCFSKTPALSPTGRCRPFAADADGTMLGEGLGMFALKRLEDAERDADRIYAVLRGLGASSDGRAKSVFAPRSGGQAKALRRAYAAAGYAPTTVGLMEAHGTGTRAGDAAELSGLQEVFGREGAEPWCALGSVKSQIGHTKSAAAAAGLMKVVYALHHKVLPPTLGVNAPAEALREPGCAFYANTATRPWIAAQPRRASISSFGFGGTNFHLTVEEYAGPRAAHRRVRDLDAELVLVSGVDPADLVDQIDALAAGLGRDGDLQAGLLPFVARETQGRFDPSFPARLAIVARDEADLHGKLERARERVGRGEAFADPGFTTVFRVGRPEPGGLVVLFPGQGSQRLGMGGDLARSFDRARQVWDDDARHPVVGRPLADLVFPAPAQDDESRTLQAAALRATDHAQPALGAASMAAWTLLRPLGLQPMAFAGHSFGEVTALWAGGVLDDGALLEVAAARGATMAEEAARADTPAGMTAVSAPAATLAWVEEHGIVLANLNAPRQTVISGSLEKLDGVEAEMSANGIPFRRLDVATAFHSPFVARAAKSFAERLSGVNLHRAHTPVWSNATAGRYPDEAGDVRDRLARSIGEPVRFAEQIAALYEAGGRHFLEVGPGTVLSTLTGRILGDRPHLAVATDPGGGSEVEGLFAALGALAAHGAALDYEPLWTEFDLGPDPRHAPLPMLAVPVDGANLGRPYPRLDEQGKPIRPRRVAAPIPPPAAAPPAARPTTPSSVAAPPATPSSVAAFQSAPRAALPPVVPTSPALPPSDLAALLERVEGRIADVHERYLQVTGEAHREVLEVATSVATTLAGLRAGPPSAFASRPALGAAASIPTTSMPITSMPITSMPTVSTPTVSMPVAPPPPAIEPVFSPSAPAPAGPEAARPAPSSSVDPEAVLLAVVADKTGYPAEVLKPEQRLEAELGIDSIKRVEILSAVQQQLPGLPEMDATRLAALQTLGEVIDALRTALDGTIAPAASPAVGPDPEAVLLAVVADKTGYPAEVLKPEQRLEAELGIDSIKRVEILSAVQQQLPGLPEMDATRLAALQTLGEVIDALRTALDGTTGAPAAPDAPSSPPDAPSSPPTRVDRHVVRWTPAPPTGLVPSALRAGALAIVGTPSIARPLAARIREAGLEAEPVSTVGARHAGLIDLRCLEAVGPTALVDATSAVFSELQTFSRQREPDAPTLAVVVQDAAGPGAIDPSRAWGAGAVAVYKTLAAERPRWSVRTIELARGGLAPAQLAERIADELLFGGGELEIGIDETGARFAIEAVHEPIVSAAPRLGPQDVVVVSGGARGVTAACAVALAEATRARFVLLGRTPLGEEPPWAVGVPTDEAALRRAALESLPPGTGPAELAAAAVAVSAGREVKTTLARIEANGGDATYVSVDVTDGAAVADALDDVRRDHGPITALVHAAGVIADKRLEDKARQAFDRVVAVKVEGARALLEATRDDALKAVLFFSSVAARTGNVGQADYAAGNAVLNALARAEAVRRPHAVVRALGWGPWAGGMVTPALADHFRARSVPLIDLEDGARRFVDELEADGSPEVVIGPLPDRSERASSSPSVWLSHQSAPELDGHRVLDHVVVPMVWAIELFCRAAAEGSDGEGSFVCEDLRVLCGIEVPAFDAQGMWLTVEAASRDGALDMSLVDEAGKRRIVATLGRPHEGNEASPPRAMANGASWPWRADAVYDGPLFHRGAFSVIDTLESLGHAGASARVSGVRQRAWSTRRWQTDPAALDAALQLLLLWARAETDQAALPLRIARTTWHGGPSATPLRCELRARRDGPTIHADAWLLDDADRAVGRLEGVEVHLLGRDQWVPA